MEWANVAVPTVQYTHGMLSCCEFTGVPLSALLEDCGFDRKKARYVLAESADGASLTRTIGMDRALDDAIVAWGMNGEMLRPENGYPLRLVVPGVQGVSWVKWLRRIEVGDQPWHTREEVMHYIDLMPDGIHRQFTSIQEAKSVITTPSGGQQLLGKGLYAISGLAWSGRGPARKEARFGPHPGREIRLPCLSRGHRKSRRPGTQRNRGKIQRGARFGASSRRQGKVRGPGRLGYGADAPNAQLKDEDIRTLVKWILGGAG
jgi:DMSO/TMAO reductase YedYZ molybdopterin-dependent catalytic subunit